MGGVEGLAVVGKGDVQHTIAHLAVEPDAGGMGVTDDVGHGLFDGQTQTRRLVVGKTRPAADSLDESLQMVEVAAVGAQREGVAAMPADGHERDVVALLGTADVALRVAAHQLHQLAGREGRRLAGLFQHAATRERALVAVAGLVQSVGIEEEGVAGMEPNRLPLVVPRGQRAHGQVVLDVERIAAQGGLLVSGVAVVQRARRQVEYPHEHRHEVAAALLLAQQRVHSRHNGRRQPRRLSCMLRQCHSPTTVSPAILGSPPRLGPKQRPHHRHQQCGGHTLARDITDTKEKPVAADEEVVEIAADLAGRCQCGV